MTPEEHQFLLFLFARQNNLVNVLYEALRARGVLQQGDLDAYASYARLENPEQMLDWLRRSWAAYQATAASLGITTGLEGGLLPLKNQG